jgi:hypothetical protein
MAVLSVKARDSFLKALHLSPSGGENILKESRDHTYSREKLTVLNERNLSLSTGSHTGYRARLLSASMLGRKCFLRNVEATDIVQEGWTLP